MNRTGHGVTSGQNPAVLSLQGVSKKFGDFQAVKDVSFDVRRGEVFGFLGPNGAGKSTTIRMILDVLRPTDGSISLFGQSSRDVRATHRRLGFLSGDMAMDTNLTGRQYLTFVAAQYGKDCRQDADQLARELQSHLDVRIGNYSRGNRQKIGLIAALQHQPELLILDEPTSGFDPLVQELFAKLILSFKQAGGTVLMSSHILTEVQQLCDRVAFIKDGQIVQTTSVDSLTDSAAKRVRVRAPAAELKELRNAVAALDGVKLQVDVGRGSRDEVSFSYNGRPKPLLQLLARFNSDEVTIQEIDLEEVFMHYYEPKGRAS